MRRENARNCRGLLLALGLFAGLAACTQQPLPGVDPTPPRAAPPPPVSAPAYSAPLVTGETSVPAETVEKDAQDWEAAGVSDAQHQADLQSCYAFANAQVRHDERINDDRATLFSGNNPALAGNLYSYNQAIRPYDAEQRFGELFRGCMASRGYQSENQRSLF